MNDSEARAYLETIKKAGLITHLIDSDNWVELKLSKFEQEALAAWKYVAEKRPDIVGGKHPDIWLPGGAILARFARFLPSVSNIHRVALAY
jgi:hypothetical protein